MAVKTNLFDCGNPQTWNNIFSLYPSVLKLKAAKKTKPQAKKELISLDNWYQNELPDIIKERSDPHITLNELEQLMKWKLSRGKFRPMLPKLIASNKPADVINASKKAFNKLPDLRKAIDALSVLRGVGPATASAVLTAGCPHEVPFMADESVMAIPGISVIKYDINCYLQFAQGIKDKLEWLHKEDEDGEWTAHKVELCVWTDVMARQLDPSLLNTIYSADSASAQNGNNPKVSRKRSTSAKLEQTATNPKKSKQTAK